MILVKFSKRCHRLIKKCLTIEYNMILITSYIMIKKSEDNSLLHAEEGENITKKLIIDYYIGMVKIQIETIFLTHSTRSN